MFVDTRLLHSGSDQSYQAGAHAHAGAARLSQGPLPPGMFGDFGAADVFHEAINSSRARHVKVLQDHQNSLIALGDKAYRAAREFTDMDESNSTQLRMV